jgi:hypothetical protein
MGEATLIEEHRRLFAPRLWLAAAAILFAALWGWRELAIRAAKEIIASRDAEIRRLAVDNTRLADQLARLNFEMTVLAMPGTKAFIVTAPGNGSARVFVNRQGQGLAIIDNLPENAAEKSYELWVARSDQPKPQSVTVFDMPVAGAKTIQLEHLPALSVIKNFSVTTATTR